MVANNDFDLKYRGHGTTLNKDRGSEGSSALRHKLNSLAPAEFLSKPRKLKLFNLNFAVL